MGRYPSNKLIGRNPLPQQQPKPPFTVGVMPLRGLSGITHRFQWLSRSEGYVGYVLLTLAPLYSPEGFLARLACLIHAASVRSEPGSNPSIEVFVLAFVLEFDDRPPAEPEGERHARSAFESHPVFKEPQRRET